ncbi:MAG: hypothetical protein M3Y79_05750 [Pseudomonadota bacterium]|nr:hypothetical protein [Pseudomonadota bacterium]
MNAISGSIAAAPRLYRAITDRQVFVITAALFVVLTLAGFIPSSLAKIGAVQAGQRPPFPAVLHVHAVTMGLWLLLLLAQSGLAAAGRRAARRMLGIAGAVLLPVIVITGVLLIDATWKQLWNPATAAAMPEPVLTETRTFVSNIMLLQARALIAFPLFVVWALLIRRSDVDAHRRLMLLGTAVPVLAGLDRLSEALGWTTMPASPISMDIWLLASVLPILVADLARGRGLHFTTKVWLAVNVVMAALVNLLWNSPWWLETAPRLVGVA